MAPAFASARSRRALLDLFPTPELQLPAPSHDVADDVGGPADWLTFFGLNEPPFSLSADPRFLYHSSAHDAAAQALLSAIGRRDAVAVLGGEAGIGKTTLCRALVEELDRHTLVAMVSGPIGSRSDLLAAVLRDFGVVSHADLNSGRLAGAGAPELAVALHRFLATLRSLPAFAVVIVDEAHGLPVEVLQQVGALAEAEEGKGALHILLAGEPSLRVRLVRSELTPLASRARVRCTLERLTRSEMNAYIVHRLATAGARPGVLFEDEAVAAVFELSGGLPRTANLLCDRAMMAAYGASSLTMDRATVQAAAREMAAGTRPRPVSKLRLAVGFGRWALAGLGFRPGRKRPVPS